MAGSGVVAFEVTNGSADVQAVAGADVRLFGFHFINDATATTIVIRDADTADTTGRKLFEADLAANEEWPPTPAWFGPMGIRMKKGIRIDRDGSNSVQGVVFHG